MHYTVGRTIETVVTTNATSTSLAKSTAKETVRDELASGDRTVEVEMTSRIDGSARTPRSHGLGRGLLADVYALPAVAAYWVLSVVWTNRPSLGATTVIVGLLPLAFGYLNYQFATARILGRIDAVELTRADAPELADCVDRLADRMAIARPRIMVGARVGPESLVRHRRTRHGRPRVSRFETVWTPIGTGALPSVDVPPDPPELYRGRL